MPLDPSIILSGQQFNAPDILGQMGQAMTLKRMAQQGQMQDKEIQDQEAMKKAYEMNMIPTPGGAPSLDKQKFLSDMGKISPEKAMALENQFSTQDTARKNQEIETAKKQIDLAHQLSWSMNDQDSYTRAREMGIKLGLPNSEKLPMQYDPNMVKQMQEKSFSAKERMDQHWKQKELGFKERELALKEAASTRKEQNSGSSAGRKKVDQEFAKDYNEWTSGKAEIARSEIDKLQSVVESLESKKVTTGGLTGMFPDRITSDKVLGARSDVQSTVMNSLRAIMGAAFTEKEGERVINNTWNEADTTENNTARLKRLISDLAAQANAKDEKSRYYERSGETLSGYKPGGALVNNRDDANAVKWARDNPKDPRATKILKMHGLGG